MTDLETQLRLDLHAGLDSLVASPATAASSVAAGRRAQLRRRAAVLTSALTLAALAVGAALAVPHDHPGAFAAGVRSVTDAQHLVELVAAGREEQAESSFAPEYRRALSVAGLRHLWSTVIQDQLGGYRSSSTGRVSGTRSFSADISTRDGRPASVLIDTDRQGNVTRFFVRPTSDSAEPVVEMARAFGSGVFSSQVAGISDMTVASTWMLAEADGGALIEIGVPVHLGDTVRLPLVFDHGTADLSVTYRGSTPVSLTLLRTDHTLDPQARELIRQLNARQFTTVHERFDAVMTAQFTATALEHVWGSSSSPAEIVAITSPRARTARILCSRADGELVVLVSWDAEGRISALRLTPALTFYDVAPTANRLTSTQGADGEGRPRGCCSAAARRGRSHRCWTSRIVRA